MKGKLAEEVRRIIAKEKNLPVEKVQLDSSFLDLGIESLDGVTIAFALEDRFDINIPDQAAFEFKTVRQVVEALDKLLSQSEAPSGQVN